MDWKGDWDSGSLSLSLSPSPSSLHPRIYLLMWKVAGLILPSPLEFRRPPACPKPTGRISSGTGSPRLNQIASFSFWGSTRVSCGRGACYPHRRPTSRILTNWTCEVYCRRSMHLELCTCIYTVADVQMFSPTSIYLLNICTYLCIYIFIYLFIYLIYAWKIHRYFHLHLQTCI